MRIGYLVFWTQKNGNSETDYEDAFWPKTGAFNEEVKKPIRIAIGDGATESSFSGTWAKLLTRNFAKDKFLRDSDEPLLCELSSLRRRWKRTVQLKPLPWYAEEKLQAGAFSSILGLTIRPTKKGVFWNSVSVGDSCLFMIHNNKLKESYPITESASFNSRPYLLSSIRIEAEEDELNLSFADGKIESGDTLYLLTDALAQWFLKEHEQGNKPWERLNEFTNQQEFIDWISEIRTSKSIRNDDVTSVKIQISF